MILNFNVDRDDAGAKMMTGAEIITRAQKLCGEYFYDPEDAGIALDALGLFVMFDANDIHDVAGFIETSQWPTYNCHAAARRLLKLHHWIMVWAAQIDLLLRQSKWLAARLFPRG